MTPRQARIGVDIFTAIVVASVGVALAGLTWRLMGDPGTRLGASPVAARPAPPVDISPLIALAPFGTATAPGSSPDAGNQPLTLRGILLAQPRSASSALISIGDASPVAFYVGQAVGSATVDAIDIDHVVLLTSGSRSTLGFPRPEAGSPSSVAAPGPSFLPPALTASSAPPSPPIVAPLPAAAPANGGAMLDSLGATPSPGGLTVGNPNQAMRMAGLQPGDQIVAINGNPANELAHNPALLAPIIAAGSARIDIVRAGQKLTLSVPVK